MKKIILILFFFEINSSFATAQIQKITAGKESRQRAEQNIKDLHDGTLIVRLESGRNLRRELHLLDSTDLKARSYLTKKLAHIALENSALVSQMLRKYSFSKFLMLYDTNITALQNGRTAGIFLDSLLQPDRRLQLETQSYFFLYKGKTNTENTTGVSGLLFADAKNKVLEPPFPYYFSGKKTSLVTFFYAFIGTEKNVTDIDENSIKKINARLKKYYLKTVQSAMSD